MFKKLENGKVLVESIKKNKNVYEYIYSNKKDLLLDSILKDEQKQLIDFANMYYEIDNFNDYFKNYHHDEIEIILKENLNIENLKIEYNIFIEKIKMLKNYEEMSYQDIMNASVDIDEFEYSKDFNIMIKLIKSVKNLYLYGNAGNGKTTFAYNVASELELQLYNINSVKNEFSVKGFFNLDGVYELSLYEKWYRDGGVLLLDEVDSYSSNGMLYLNNGVEVNSKYLTLENGDVVFKNKDCYVIACANTDGSGKNIDYIGRNAIDKAFMSRFTKKEYKEYAHIHKNILGKENYQDFKEFFENRDIQLTCRLCVKIKGLLVNFEINEIKLLIENKEIEL